MGSFVPWLYYGFYCEPYSWILYLVLIVALGLVAMIVALWDKFSDPGLRPLRAGIFSLNIITSSCSIGIFFVMSNKQIKIINRFAQKFLIRSFLQKANP